jgi:hypothetical protein
MSATSRSKVTLAALAVLFALLVYADEKVKLSMSEYRQRKFESVNPEAYRRALGRIKNARVGMPTDQFFDTMEMLIVRDKKGAGIDGFVEGYLQAESNEESERARPDSILLFGYYEDWKKRQKPVKKFKVVFRDKVCDQIAFFDPAEDPRPAGDPRSAAGGGSAR